MVTCPTVHAAFYLWYGTPDVDGRWLHWDHATLPHWDEAVRKRLKRTKAVQVRKVQDRLSDGVWALDRGALAKSSTI